jgi:glyoxylase-like metal-dependent hydrolase (beta-lactamase superfamily II)/rhodanese-related sulfurtransferase
VLFAQILNGDLGCASYLVGCEEAGEVVVVDPHLEIEPILAEAERLGARIVRTLETHTHADHVSGHGRLALDHGVPVSIHPLAEPGYPFDALEDGDEITIGRVVLRCIHTPGHRPEHCCFAVVDTTRSDEPWLVLTGDSLFVGDAARPDLAVGALEGAEGMYRSLRRLLELPDGVEVFPGHVAGSLCGASMSSRSSTTIGFERRFNRMLGISELDAFVAESAGVSTPKPPNLARIVELNRGPFRPTEAPVPELPAPPEDAQLLDVRPVAGHLAGHRPGAVNVPVSGASFATKAAFVLDPARPVVVLAASAAEAERAVAGLRSVAFETIAGFVLGGGEEETLPVAIDELEALVEAGAVVVDVREKDERDEGYIPGSRNIPYRLMRACCPDLPEDGPIVTICSSGPRAAIAASILRAKGHDARPVVDGGMSDWLARGATAVSFRRCGS